MLTMLLSYFYTTFSLRFFDLSHQKKTPIDVLEIVRVSSHCTVFVVRLKIDIVILVLLVQEQRNQIYDVSFISGKPNSEIRTVWKGFKTGYPFIAYPCIILLLRTKSWYKNTQRNRSVIWRILPSHQREMIRYSSEQIWGASVTLFRCSLISSKGSLLKSSMYRHTVSSVLIRIRSDNTA